jgi:sterol carrier protein 2
MDVVGYEMTKTCADKVFKDAGFSPGEGRDQVGVVELHDCFAANEVCMLAQSGLKYIQQARLVDYIPRSWSL